MQCCFVFVSSSWPQCHPVALSSRDLLFTSVQIRSCEKATRNLNKNYTAAPVRVCVREGDSRTTVPGAVKGNSWETKAKLPKAIPGSRGKRCFSSLPPCLSMPWAGRASQSLFGPFRAGAVLPLWAWKQVAPGGWAMLFVSLPALPASSGNLRELIPRKGVSDHHLPCTLPVPSQSSHCFHHAPQSCYRTVSLHGNSHNDQGPGGFLHPGDFFLDDFVSPALRANSTRVSYCMSSWFLHSSLPCSLSHSWHMPKFVEGISVTSVFHQLPWDFSVLFWRVKRNFIHDLAEDTWPRVGLSL